MSVYIPGMEMPTSCFYCPFREKVDPDDYVCMALNKEFEETFSLIAGHRHKDCPLVPVPPHGDLIDRDALQINDPIRSMMVFSGEIVIAKSAIDKAPTIIPADKEGE